MVEAFWEVISLGERGLPRERTPLFLVYQRRARFVSPLPLAVCTCRGPDDDLVLATALAAQAGVIITGDKDLLTLKTRGGFRIRIRSPRQFMDAPKAISDPIWKVGRSFARRM